MVTVLMVIFGILTGSLLSVLVGLVGSRRRIGFGWAFIISLLLTPVVGLIVTLISEPLPGERRRWGCLALVLGVLALACLAVLLSLILTGGLVLGALL